MNIDYVSFAYLQEYEQKFKGIINDQPAVAQAYEKTKTTIEESIFKGKLEPVMFVSKNQVWFAASIINTYSAVNFARAYSGLYCKLVREMENDKITVV